MIADAGIAVIARDGLRALTHRAVDREAGLPQGSSSYYVSTRRTLLELIAERLAGRTLDDIGQAVAASRLPQSAETSDPVVPLAAAVTALIDMLSSRREDMIARYALLLELGRDDPLHAVLSSQSDVQRAVADEVAAALDRLDVPDASSRATELVKLADAMVFRQVALDDAPITRGVIESYLRGMIPLR